MDLVGHMSFLVDMNKCDIHDCMHPCLTDPNCRPRGTGLGFSILTKPLFIACWYLNTRTLRSGLYSAEWVHQILYGCPKYHTVP